MHICICPEMAPCPLFRPFLQPASAYWDVQAPVSAPFRSSYLHSGTLRPISKSHAAFWDMVVLFSVVRYRIARNGGTLEHRFASGMIVYDCRLGRATAPPYRSTRNTRPHVHPIPRILYAFAVRPMRSRPMPSCYDMCGR